MGLGGPVAHLHLIKICFCLFNELEVMNWIQIRFLSHVCFVSHVIKTAKQMKGLSFHSAFLLEGHFPNRTLYLLVRNALHLILGLSPHPPFFPPFFFPSTVLALIHILNQPQVLKQAHQTSFFLLQLWPINLCHPDTARRIENACVLRTLVNLHLPRRWVQSCWCPPVKERKAHDGPPK